MGVPVIRIDAMKVNMINIYFIGGFLGGRDVEVSEYTFHNCGDLIYKNIEGRASDIYKREVVIYKKEKYHFLIHESLINSNSKIDLISDRLGELENAKEI